MTKRGARPALGRHRGPMASGRARELRETRHCLDARSTVEPSAACARSRNQETALAHVQKGEAVGFVTGFRHPISGLDHVLAMVAVGLWGAQLGAPAIWLLPVAFPLVMAFGGALGLLGVPLPGTKYGIAASAILLGAAVMFELRPRLAIAAMLVGFFAIFHGHAHGTELPPGQSALLYSMGFVIATGCLHAVAIGIWAGTGEPDDQLWTGARRNRIRRL